MNLPFNGRNRITQPWSKAHYGLDIVGDDSKTVHAVCAGKVVSSTIITNKNNRTWEWGNYVCVADNNGIRYYYCHLSSRKVSVGSVVKQGDIIGIMGNTGKSYGAHLHLQIRDKSAKELNVADVLNIKNARATVNSESTSESQSPSAPPAQSTPPQTPSNPPQSQACKLLIGFVSRGDQAKIEALARELQVPCVVQNNLLTQGIVKLLVGEVSSGDKSSFEKMASEMRVPYVEV